MKRWVWFIILFCLGVLCTFDQRVATADENQEKPCRTGTLQLKDIPVGSFFEYAWPLRKSNGAEVFVTTQKYNTGKAQALKNGDYGHTGIDIISTEGPGNADVLAVERGKVVELVDSNNGGGWGSHVAVAARVSNHSDQIITFHYAHMDFGSLKPELCEDVKKGDVIGKEGKTGNVTATHLHWEIRLWNNIGELNEALKPKSDKKGKIKVGSVFDQGYWCNSKFCDNQYLKNNKFLHPYFLFTERFREFECQDEKDCPLWARRYALALRRAGLDFGRYDGYFAMNHDEGPAIDLLHRGEAARWVKVGKTMTTKVPKTPTYSDVPANNPYFPYVETLLDKGILKEPAGPLPRFDPDQAVTRAELLKMVIEAFMKKEFDHWIQEKDSITPWGEAAEIEGYYTDTQLNQFFKDLHDESTGEWHWGHHYILFAAFNKHKRLIEVRRENYGPDTHINKIEAARVLMLARDFWKGEDYKVCDDIICGPNTRCSGTFVEDEDGDYTVLHCQRFLQCDYTPCKDWGTEVGGGTGETPSCTDFVCTPGDEKQQPCGMAGTQTQTCNSDCQWDPWGSCEDQGTCSPGESAMCGNCGIMTCGSDGLWGMCQNEGTCTPGESQQRSCGTNGTQTATCNASCQWEPWSTCQESCVCSSGQCCDGCNFLPSTQLCNNGYQYRCEGSARGQDAQQRYLATYCLGTDAGCNGETVPSSWEIYEDCSSNEVCQMTGDRAACITACTDRYVADTTLSCDNVTGPMLCLEVEQLSGPSWRFRICHESVTYMNNFDYRIEDHQLFGVYAGKYTDGEAGSSCSPWRPMDMSYLPADGTPAALMGSVFSPAGCDSCEYRTGYVQIYKECR